MASKQAHSVKEHGKAGQGGPKRKDRNNRGRRSDMAPLMEHGLRTDLPGEVSRYSKPQEHQSVSETPIGTAEEAYANASALERGHHSLTRATGDQIRKTGTRMASHWLSKALFPKPKNRSRLGRLRWQRPLVVKQRDCRTFAMELLSSTPAVLYTVTALSPLFLDAHPEVQLGLQVANVVLLLVLMGMGLIQGRFSDENRWYLRHYFIWTIVTHLAAFYLGSYSDLIGDGIQAIQALSICRTVQAVQAFPLWSVELFDVDRLKVEKLS